MSAPHLPLKVLVGSPNPYFGYVQRNHQIISRLVKGKIFQVDWIDNPNFLPYQIDKRFKEAMQDTLRYVRNRPIRVENYLSVYKAFSMPFYGRSGASWILSEKLMKVLFKRLDKYYDVFIVNHPLFLEGAKILHKKGTTIIYDCFDYFAGWTRCPMYAIVKEKELVKMCELVIVSSYRLYEKMKEINHNTVRIPNGVPSSRIGRCKNSKATGSKPKIGFVGVFGDWVDFETILNIAREKAEWLFMFAGDGPLFREIVKSAPRNCIFLGKIPYAKVENFICDIDVGIIPFKDRELTEAAFPMKLLEYFAKGKPVVSTPLYEVKKIASDLVHFANTYKEWVSGIERALRDEREEDFIRFAQVYTWERIAEKFLREIIKVIET